MDTEFPETEICGGNSPVTKTAPRFQWGGTWVVSPITPVDAKPLRSLLA